MPPCLRILLPLGCHCGTCTYGSSLCCLCTAAPARSVLALLSSTVTASVTLHNKLLSHILRLPKAFFDTNPAGRVLNRFSKDVETMDSVLNQSISQLVNCFATYFATLIVITIATKWFGLAVIPITAVYIILQVCAVSACEWEGCFDVSRLFCCAAAVSAKDHKGAACIHVFASGCQHNADVTLNMHVCLVSALVLCACADIFLLLIPSTCCVPSRSAGTSPPPVSSSAWSPSRAHPSTPSSARPWQEWPPSVPTGGRPTSPVLVTL